MKRGLLLLMVMCFVTVTAASSHLPADTLCADTLRINYPLSRTHFDPDYMGNDAVVERIIDYLQRSPRMDSIIIRSFASPEGPLENNARLARNRGLTAQKYLLELSKEYRYLSAPLIIIDDTPENWHGLRELIVKEYNRPDRDKVLEIIDAEGIGTETRKWRLQQLDGGNTWRYILRNYMPRLRYAEWTFVLVPPPLLSNIISLNINKLPPPLLDSISGSIPVPEPDDYKTLFALKSNLLYDALTMLNFSVEVPFSIGKQKFSVLAQHQFPWWLNEKNNKCFRFLSTGVEGRWWFRPQPRVATDKRLKRDALTGHFVGVYGLSGKWDFQYNRKGCYQGEFWSVGIDYGYSMPIGKRLNLEFSFALGYASIPYRHYLPSEDWSILYRDPNKHGRWHYFGPTRAEVSLVIPIYNKFKKGGLR